MLQLSSNYAAAAVTPGSSSPTTTKGMVADPLDMLKKEVATIPSQVNSCWNIELDDDTLFCYGMVSSHKLYNIMFRSTTPSRRSSTRTRRTTMIVK